jgi:pimeloyl-ACP methyl ester carboxylesterase
MREDRGVRRDLGKILRGVDKRHVGCGAGISGFASPVLLVWAAEDELFPISLAERMMRLFPNVSLQPVKDSYTFIPEDQPGRLAELIIQFSSMIN